MWRRDPVADPYSGPVNGRLLCCRVAAQRDSSAVSGVSPPGAVSCRCVRWWTVFGEVVVVVPEHLVWC